MYVSGECTNIDARFFLHIIPFDTDALPESRKASGLGLPDLFVVEAARRDSPKCAFVCNLPEYDIAVIFTGQFTAAGRIWKG